MEKWIKITIVALGTTLVGLNLHINEHQALNLPYTMDFKELVTIGATFFGTMITGMLSSPFSKEFKD